jgi:probable rRNA maturation factor
MSTLTADIEVLTEAGAADSCPIDALAELARFALRESGAQGTWSVAIVLTDDDRLRRLHRDFMGIDEPTDVMTFPYDADAPDSGHGGDVVISVERAADQGPENGLSTCEEVAFLAVHGVLHLCGWNDESPALRQRMLARQTEIVEAFAQRNQST